MALINKDNENKASAVTFEDKLEDHHYSKMFISCPSVSLASPRCGSATALDVFTVQIDKSTKINIE